MPVRNHPTGIVASKPPRLWGMYLVIGVENSCSGSQGRGRAAGVPASSGAGGSSRPPSGDVGRQDDDGTASPFPDLSVPHGWGQGIVREVARRHDGTFEAGQVDGVYRVRVILKQDRAARDGVDGEWSR